MLFFFVSLILIVLVLLLIFFIPLRMITRNYIKDYLIFINFIFHNFGDCFLETDPVSHVDGCDEQTESIFNLYFI